VVIVFSDTGAREMRLFAAEVVESTEVSTGRDSLGEFELYDLVQLK